MITTIKNSEGLHNLKILLLCVLSLVIMGIWLNRVTYAQLDEASKDDSVLPISSESEQQAAQTGNQISTDTNETAAATDPNKLLLNNSAEFNTLGGKQEALESAQIAYFQVSGEEHSVTVNEFNEESARVTIASEPFEATLQRDEPQSFDVNDDANQDIEITYLGPEDNRANFRFAQVNTTETQDSNDANTNSEQAEASGGISRTWLIVGAGAVALVGLVALYNRENRSKPRRRK